MYIVIFVFLALYLNCEVVSALRLPFPSIIPDHNHSLKQYSGLRVNNDSIRMVYYYDQTVAVVEVGHEKLLLNCELIEVFNPEQVFEVLGELRQRIRPLAINFQEMINLMHQCNTLDYSVYFDEHNEFRKNISIGREQAGGVKNIFSLLNGIVPGTKWCGTGDIAKDYFDLGQEKTTDACCRAHDLCPIKIRPYSEKYNLTNNSLYTKSHCKCDDDLYSCLKHNSRNTAHIMGNIYFNIVRVQCLEDTNAGKIFRNARNDF